MPISNKNFDTSAIDKIKNLPENFTPDDPSVVLPANPPADPTNGNPPAGDPPANPPTNEPPANPDPNNQPPADPNPNPAGDPPAEDPYKRKFAESSREAQILASKNRKITETIEQAAALPEPTEEELKAKYTDWDNLTDFEKQMAKDAYISSKRFGLINQAVIENSKVDEWAKKVDEYVENPTTLQNYKDLEGRQAEFRSFAMKESRRGLDMEELVKYFLAVEPKPTAPVAPGTMVQRPNGGNPPKPAAPGYTVEQAALLRKTDHKKYNELVMSGVIKIELPQI